MLALVFQQPASGRGTQAVERDANAFHDAALASGLNVATAPDGATLTATGDPRSLAALYAEVRTGGIPHVTMQRDGDDDAMDADIFRATLADLGIDLASAEIQ